MSNPNVALQVKRAFVANLPDSPGTGATTVLFATHPRKPGGSGTAVTSTFVRQDGTQTMTIAPDAIEKVEVVYALHDHASAANGLRVYQTNDGGTTWIETDMKGPDDLPSCGSVAPIQVPALSAGQEWAEEFTVGRYRGIAIEHTAGATPPTAVTGWQVSVSVRYTEQSGGA